MTSIPPLDRLLQALQSQARPAAEPRPAVSRRQETRPNEARAREREEVSARLARKIQSIDPDHPRRARQALRFLLESGLLERLGSEAEGDPTFTVLVDKILQTMEATPSLQSDLQAAADTLLNHADDPKKLTVLIDAFRQA